VQVDVFSDRPFGGNPVGVVLDAEGLAPDDMQRLSSWANLSETTFVLGPTRPGADFRARIFSPMGELPFAGHPTLGTAHAWLEHTGWTGTSTQEVVQECAAGLVRVRRAGPGLFFEAPPVLHGGPVAPEALQVIVGELGLSLAEVVDAQWVDNGPGWVALLLEDAAAVLAVRPGRVTGTVGVVGPYPKGAGAAYEVRAFFPKGGSTAEDPVTGSLNASLAQWLVGSGRVVPPYMVSQGTALGRQGRVYVEVGHEGGLWVGGSTATCIEGTVLA